MRKAFLNWGESYVETFRYTRFLTQIFSFSMALVLVLEVVKAIHFNLTYEGEISSQLKLAVAKELSLQVFFAFLLAFRFLLLFLKDNKYFWLSQFVWLFTYLMLITQISGAGCTKNAFPIFGETLSCIFVAYLFFSPLRQITTLLASFGRISVK
ncbi:MAG TPA: hypothetical protein VIL74_00280 [Pyrinomonadaceae bacterium]|jgi:hypothetical protein